MDLTIIGSNVIPLNNDSGLSEICTFRKPKYFNFVGNYLLTELNQNKLHKELGFRFIDLTKECILYDYESKLYLKERESVYQEKIISQLKADANVSNILISSVFYSFLIPYLKKEGYNVIQLVDCKKEYLDLLYESSIIKFDSLKFADKIITIFEDEFYRDLGLNNVFCVFNSKLKNSDFDFNKFIKINQIKESDNKLFSYFGYGHRYSFSYELFYKLALENKNKKFYFCNPVNKNYPILSEIDTSYSVLDNLIVLPENQLKIVEKIIFLDFSDYVSIPLVAMEDLKISGFILNYNLPYLPKEIIKFIPYSIEHNFNYIFKLVNQYIENLSSNQLYYNIEYSKLIINLLLSEL